MILAAAMGHELDELGTDAAAGFRFVAEFMQDVHFHRKEYLSAHNSG